MQQPKQVVNIEPILYTHMYFKIRKHIGIMLFALCTLVAAHSAAHAQQTPKAYVFAHNKGKIRSACNIELKWFTERIESGGGVYVYRQDIAIGGWLRLNSKPLLPTAKIDSTAKKNDEELIFFEQLLKVKRPSQLEGMTLLSVWLKAFQSNAMAKFLGVYYNDSTVVEGKSYRYKVVQLINGAPKEIGITATIKAQAIEQFEMPIQELKLTSGKKKITFMWKEEPVRFWGVNVYRRVKGAEQFIKVNSNPVMVNKTVDSLGNPIPLDRLYEDDSLQENTLYEYQVAGVDFFGNETQRTTSQFCYLKDKTAPGQPHLKLDSVYLLRVYLSYTPVLDTDVKGYYIYRSTTSDGLHQRLNKEPMNPENHIWIDSVSKTSPYYYFVSAIDTAGNETASERIIANVEDVFEPEKPKLISVKGDTGMVHLAWEANVEKDVWGYYVYRGIGKTALNKMVLLNADPHLTTFYTDTINKAATNSFCYAIRAVDSSYNRSAYSDTLSAAMPDIIPPGKPFIKSVTRIDNTHLQISWIPNYEKDLLGYNIYVKDSATALPVKINTTLTPVLPNTFTYTPTNSGPIMLFVTAVDKSGNESEKSIGFAFMYKPVLNNTDTQELILEYKKKNKSCIFTWQYTGTNTFKGYVLYVRTDNEYRAVNTLQQKEVYKMNATSVASGIYEVRVYFNDGTFIRSNKQEVNIK
jgi:uncharacterized protein